MANQIGIYKQINKDSVLNNIAITTRLKIPSIYDKNTDINPEIGTIIYDIFQSAFYGYNNTGWVLLGSGSTTVNLENAGTNDTTSLVYNDTSPILSTKGLIAGDGISFDNISNLRNIIITNTSPATDVTLSNKGSISTFDLVATGYGTGPDLGLKGLIPGTGITMLGTGTDLTINTNISLSSSGGTSLVKTGAVPNLTVRGLTAGDGITLTQNVNDILVTSKTGNVLTIDTSNGPQTYTLPTNVPEGYTLTIRMKNKFGSPITVINKKGAVEINSSYSVKTFYWDIQEDNYKILGDNDSFYPNVQELPRTVPNDLVLNTNPFAGFGNPNIALSGDGNTLAFAYPINDEPGNGFGAVWVYLRNGTNWVQDTVFYPGFAGGNNEALGYGCAISSDGNTIVATCFLNPNTRVYKKNNGNWTQEIISASHIYRYVAINATGTIIAFSSDGVCNVYEYTTVWTHIFDFGEVDPLPLVGPCSIDSTGNTIVVPAYFPTSNEFAPHQYYTYILTKNNDSVVNITNSYITKIVYPIPFPPPTNQSSYKMSSAISGDGTVFAVGFPEANKVYIFTSDGNEWTQSKPITNTNLAPTIGCGFSLALTKDGNTLLVGCPTNLYIWAPPRVPTTNLGGIAVYSRKNNNWFLTKEIQCDQTTKYQGTGVATSADGSISAFCSDQDGVTIPPAFWVYT